MRQLKLNCLIFLAAGLAGLFRYGLTLLFPSLSGLNLTLLAINYSGIALLAYFVKNALPAKGLPRDWQSIFGIGFLGGFTTIASPLLDTVLALQNGKWQLALAYGFYYVIGGWLIAYITYRLAEKRYGE